MQLALDVSHGWVGKTYSVFNFGAHNAIDGHAVCADYEVDDWDQMELGEDHTEGAQYRDGRGEHLPGEENVIDAIDVVTVAARWRVFI